MQDKNEQTANMPNQALEAMEDVIISDDVANIKSSLTEFFYEWIQSEDDHDHFERRTKVFHYRVILGLLSQAEQMQAGR